MRFNPVLKIMDPIHHHLKKSQSISHQHITQIYIVLHVTSRTEKSLPYSDENKLVSAPLVLTNWLHHGTYSSSHVTPIFLDIVHTQEYGHRLVWIYSVQFM
jgi:hypothetical protein